MLTVDADLRIEQGTGGYRGAKAQGETAGATAQRGFKKWQECST